MSLLVHEFSHILLSVFVAFVIYKCLKPKEKFLIILLAALVGGVLIDSDHLFDYVMTFGVKFKLNSFLQGYEFLVSDKIYLPLHAWEWGILLGVGAAATMRKNLEKSAVILALCLGLVVHLMLDSSINHVTIQGYSFIYRAVNNFSIEKLVTKEHWKNHKKQREQLIQRL